MSHTKQTKKDGQPVEKLGRKRYEKELARLQGELVRLQEWVVREGVKVCVVFEGRDTAGKGGVIKRITERVSPRVFRVVALPAADRAREVPDVRAALPAAFSGGRRGRDLRPQLVQPRRRERVMGFCSEDEYFGFCDSRRWDGEIDRASEHTGSRRRRLVALARGHPVSDTGLQIGARHD